MQSMCFTAELKIGLLCHWFSAVQGGNGEEPGKSHVNKQAKIACVTLLCSKKRELYTLLQEKISISEFFLHFLTVYLVLGRLHSRKVCRQQACSRASGVSRRSEEGTRTGPGVSNLNRRPNLTLHTIQNIALCWNSQINIFPRTGSVKLSCTIQPEY